MNEFLHADTLSMMIEAISILILCTATAVALIRVTNQLIKEREGK